MYEIIIFFWRWCHANQRKYKNLKTVHNSTAMFFFFLNAARKMDNLSRVTFIILDILWLFQAVTSLVAHLSYIASRTWVNLRWRSSGATVDPRLPHRNLMWNSVRKASDSSSSLLQPSRAISAFLRKSGRFSASLRAASRCDQTIDRPQSDAEFSHGERTAAASPEGVTVPVEM